MQNSKTEQMEILAKLQEIFHEVFNEKCQEMDLDTSIEEIDGCDSISQIQIIMGIEKTFQIEFYHEEIMQIKNIGDMVEMIKKHINVNK